MRRFYRGLTSKKRKNMFKYFTTRFGTSIETNIKALRKEFPGMSFTTGMRKDQRGIYCLKDMETREYGDSWETPQGDTFFAPNEANKKKIIETLATYKTDPEERIQVKLVASKITLDIFPASAIPQKVMFSRKMPKAEVAEDNPYNTTDEYGKAAYELYFSSRSGETLRFDDDKFQKFVMMTLTRSYKLPVEMWDALELISMGDFDPLFAAGCGINYELLVKTLAESNGQH
jgi:hypothetical protein